MKHWNIRQHIVWKVIKLSSIIFLQADRKDEDGLNSLLEQLKQAQEINKSLKPKLKQYEELDPDALVALKTEAEVNTFDKYRIFDNIFLGSWNHNTIFNARSEFMLSLKDWFVVNWIQALLFFLLIELFKNRSSFAALACTAKFTWNS